MRSSTFLRTRPIAAGLALIGLVSLVALLLLTRQNLVATLSPGETLTVQFVENYELRPNESLVKIAGSGVGQVRSVEQSKNGSIDVAVKLNTGTRALLGTAPTAILRPTTILGGLYYIQLYPGGNPGVFTGQIIPANRTQTPVELEKILSSIPPDAQQGLQGMVERIDTSLRAGAGNELKTLVRDAPATLRPTGVLMDGLRGENKDTDLAQLSMTANTVARVLSAKPGQLRHVVDSLASTARAFGDNSSALAHTVADLPDTLRETRVGATALSTTLDKLTDTANDARPIARALAPTLKHLDPVLHDLRPVAADLRPLLDDARPLLDRLVPTVDRGTDVLEGIRGKPLDRINGPILKELNREWKGSAPKYPNGGRDGAKFYQEIAYFFTGLNGTVQHYTATSHVIDFSPTTVGPRSLNGLSPQAETIQALLGGNLFGPPHQGPQGGTAIPPAAPGTGQGFKIPTPNPPLQPPALDPNRVLQRGPSR